MWFRHFIMSSSSATSCTVTHQTLLSMGFPRQEYWSGLSFPSPGDLPEPGIKSASPASAGRFLSLSYQGSTILSVVMTFFVFMTMFLCFLLISSCNLTRLFSWLIFSIKCDIQTFLLLLTHLIFTYICILWV